MLSRLGYPVTTITHNLGQRSRKTPKTSSPDARPILISSSTTSGIRDSIAEYNESGSATARTS